MRISRSKVAVTVIGLIGTLATGPSALASPAKIDSQIRTSAVVDAIRFDPATGARLAEIRTTFDPADASGLRRVTTQTVSPRTGEVVSESRSATRDISGSQSDPLSQPGSGGAVSASVGSGGCCSESGGWIVTVYREAKNALGWTLYRWNSQMTFCWGGGRAGVNWGYVFNCDYTPGSANYPQTSAYFTNVNTYLIAGARPNANSMYYFGWEYMNNAYHTGFYNWQQGIAPGCVAKYGCIQTTYPTVTYWAHANGEYDWATGG